MKKLILLVATLATTVSWLQAQADFAGLQKSMDSETYERSGLGKLSPEERAVLDDFIRGYVSGKQKAAASEAATKAVDRAIQEHKVEQPQVTESRLVGTFKGVGARTVFRLENGQVWAPTGGEVAPSPSIQNPRVIIFHDFFGWKMFVEGGSTVRVKPVLK